MLITRDTINFIRSHLNEAGRWANAIRTNINNTQALFFAVTARELFNELNFLDRLLTYPAEQIPVEFKKRCEQRASTPDEFISIADNPSTVTNQLYLTLAKLIFNPLDLRELLAILMPSITRCIHIQDPYVSSTNPSVKDIKAAFDNSDVYLQEGDMSFLAGVPITDTCLSDCVFIENAVFPLAQTLPIAPSFTWYTKWFRALQEYAKYPGLKEKIETHNATFRELKSDIEHGFIGLIAADLFNYLIHGLRKAGSLVTGQELADPSILTVLNHFLDDFRRLPELIQNQLKALPLIYHWANVGALLGALETGSICVETSADALQTLLTRYKNDPLLTTRHHISGSKTVSFSTQGKNNLSKTTEDTNPLPSTLVLQLLNHIEMTDAELLLWLLRSLPVTAYVTVLETIQSSPRNETIAAFCAACLNDTLSDEEKSGLLAALMACEHAYMLIPRDTVKKLFIGLSADRRRTLLQKLSTLTAIQHFLSIADYADYPFDELDHAALKSLPLTLKLEIAIHNRRYFYLLPILTIEELQAAVFTPTNNDSMIIRILKEYSGIFQSFRNLVELVHLREVPIEKFTDCNNQNLLHFIAAHATHPDACLKQLSEHEKTTLSVQKDNQGHTPIHLSNSAHVFYLLLCCQPEAKRLSLVIDSNHQLHPTISKEPSASFLLNVLYTLSETDQIPFLRAKTQTGQRVIEHIITLDKKLFHKDATKQPNKLLKLLTKHNFNNKAEFIDLVLSKNTWENIETLTRVLLIAEFTDDKYFSASFHSNKIKKLVVFMQKNYIPLTTDDCLAIIRDVANTPPTPESMVKLGYLLELLMRRSLPSSRIALLMQNNAELFNLLINRSLHTTHFNPYLFYVFIDFLRRNNDTASLTDFLNSRVALGNPVNRELTVKELLINDLVQLYASLPTSTPLTLNLISTLFSLEMTEIPVQKITVSAMYWVRKYFNDSATKPDSEAILQTLTLHFEENIHRIDVRNYIKLLKTYAECSVLVEKATTAERDSLAQHYLSSICVLLNTNQPYETLVLLNLKPIGAMGTIQSQLRPHIRLMMQMLRPITDFYYQGQFIIQPDEPTMARVIHNTLNKIAHQKHVDLPELEIILQCVPISIQDVLEAAFRANAIEVIKHLLESHRDALQPIHQKKHLISLYLKWERTFSAEVPLLLNQYGFHIVSPKRPLSSDDLSHCLQRTCRGFTGDATYAVLLIPELQRAGADFNAVDSHGLPPLFYTLNNPSIASTLVQLGADINFITKSGENVLSHYIETYCKMKHALIDYTLIETLIRAGIKTEILNRRNITVYGSKMTILGYLLEVYLKLTNRNHQSDSKECMLAALEAGATPFFFTKEHYWAYQLLQGIFPGNEILKAQANNYPQLMRDQTELVAIKEALTVAIREYKRHNPSKYAKDYVSCGADIYTLDVENKINLLQTVLQLCETTYSLEDVKNALNTVIKKFVDSDAPGIITVARYPKLPSHEVLFNLMGSFSPEAIPNIANYPTREFPHYIMGPILMDAIRYPVCFMRFLQSCAPEQFTSVRFYPLFHEVQYDKSHLPGLWTNLQNWFASLNDDQLIACITQIINEGHRDNPDWAFQHYCFEKPMLFLYRLKALAIQNDPNLIHYMHTPCDDELLLDIALVDYPESFKMSPNSALGQKLEDYFQYRKSLLNQLVVTSKIGLTLFSIDDQKKAQAIRQELKQLASFTDESLFTHFKSENKPTIKHRA